MNDFFFHGKRNIKPEAKSTVSGCERSNNMKVE
jgi:hypothetical protein